MSTGKSFLSYFDDITGQLELTSPTAVSLNHLIL